MDDNPPNHSQQLHWEIQHCNEGYVSIKSVSSGCYLDGRDAGDAAIEVLVSERNPHEEACFNWQIGECDGLLTFKCKSNGFYLDGRNVRGDIAYVTDKEPVSGDENL